MGVITDSSAVDYLLALALVLYVVYWLVTNNYNYWDVRNVPNIKRGFLGGVLLGKQSQSDAVKEIYEEFSGKRFGGCFQFKKPVLMLRDLDLINKVLVKDFTYFQDRGQPQAKNDPLSTNLFNLKGQVWRALRNKLTPTFTTGKLKGMFEQISKCGDNMIDTTEKRLQVNPEIECKTFTFEFTLDVISSCAFGVQFKPNSPDFNKFKLVVQSLFRARVMTFVRFALLMAFPKLAEFLNVSAFPKEHASYFLNLTRSTLKYRKDNNIHRNDYFQLLMTLKEQEENGKDMGLTMTDATEEDEIINQMQYTEEHSQPTTSSIKLFTEETICGNTFIFLVAGSESTATTISLILFEIAQHPDVQQQLQKEVDLVLESHSGWSYETVRDMTYLDQVVQEAQRLYPVLPVLLRECVQPYKVPDTDLILEKGVLVSIPVVGLHRDPQYYPEPDQFKPERFEGNKFKPNSTYLPFGDGPRICIAMRFALLEVKTCVARIISIYTIKPSPKTPAPLKFDVRSFTPTVKDGIWLTFERRKIAPIKT